MNNIDERHMLVGLALVVLAFLIAGYADGCIDRQTWQTCMRETMSLCSSLESSACRDLVSFTCGVRP